jgi:ketosteroid isomerase-like protein
MTTRRRPLLGAFILLPLTALETQAQVSASEASLRESISQYVAAWNRHDVQGWASFLSDDIWYTEAIDFYKRFQGRQAVITSFQDAVKETDLLWDVKRLRIMPDGTATVVVRHVAQILPKTDGKYKSSFESDPSISRWRFEGGKWRMFFFTSHKGTALAEMKKDGVE